MYEMKLLEAVGAIDDVVLKKALSYRPSTGAIEVATFSTTKEKQETQVYVQLEVNCTHNALMKLLDKLQLIVVLEENYLYVFVMNFVW